MRRYKVAFSPEAEADLLDLYDYIADQSGTQRAIGYIARIEAYCQGLKITPNRGTRRDDIRPVCALSASSDELQSHSRWSLTS